MNEQPIKPIALVKEDFIQDIVGIINSTQLPMFVIEYILKDIFNEVHAAAAKQLQEDINTFKQNMSEQNKNSQNDER